MRYLGGHGVSGNISKGNNISLDIEDPTYIVFDINIDDLSGNSPLFPKRSDKGILEFLNTYKEYDSEINLSAEVYKEFIRILMLIFPEEK